MSELNTLLERLGDRWEPQEPGTDEAITECERQLGVVFPPDYRLLLSLSNAGTLTGERSIMNFLPVEELVAFNEDDEIRTSMPGVLAIADNGGGSFYYYDVHNRLGLGEWSLLLVEFGTLSFDYSRFVGATLIKMIEAIADGEDLERRPVVRVR
ncbi:hypothetical protein GCM10009557_31840 [Virgisporangium ochraceum]|uniref:Knr4/Smi1-like domain-containing protein n=1 Tax=Virgisporangium ochraceum TaxID=65505 RepID=A0A8J4A844_9ACTN|nr:SMI1/KNR4 family protein [Virgisporangium ochraceum]GIJ75095.1 hypothetical protein Voc01_100120 [Virgisporangium ochraceum]